MEKNPRNKILEDLEAKIRSYSKMYDFTHAIIGGLVKLLQDNQKGWLVADLQKIKRTQMSRKRKSIV